MNCDDCAKSYELIKDCNVSSQPVARDETSRHCIWMAQWLTHAIKWREGGLKQDGFFFLNNDDKKKKSFNRKILPNCLKTIIHGG